MRRPRSRYAGSLLLAAVIWGGQAHAAEDVPAELLKARAAWESLDDAGAMKAIEACLLRPDNRREVMLELYELQGVIAASRRQPELARAAFVRLMTLAPERTLPGASPRVATSFYEAGGEAARLGSLVLSARSRAADGQTVRLSLSLGGNALGLARTVRVHLRADDGPWQRKELAPDAPLELEVSAGTLSWWAEALGEHRAQLVLLGSASAPMREGPSVAGATGAPGNPTKWICLAGAGAGVLVLAIGSGLGAQSARIRGDFSGAPQLSDGVVQGYTRQQALDAEARSKSLAIAGNVLMVAGMLLTSGFVAWLVLFGRQP